jgi:hypothetical protein
MNELTDPETLRECEDVEVIDAPPEEHQSHFEMFESVAGTAIAGVIDADGRLLLLKHEATESLVLPFTRVKHGDDWVAAARKAVADSTDIEVTIGEPIRVRRCTYRSEAGEETTDYDVVFTATPEADRDVSEVPGLSCQDDWSAAWHDTATLDLSDNEDDDVVSDIRLFVE